MSRINTNVQSLIARRALGINNMSLNQSLVRLSTGLRINTGKDDPAGLIASETLRANIRATTSAIDNAIRADTIVAVAEGGLQEVSSLLLELEALVDQSANEAGLTAQEVTANQLQIDAILQSINRLSEATAFGDKKLLNGDLDFTTSGVNIDEPNGNAVTHLEKVMINSAKIASGAYRQVNITRSVASEVAVLSGMLGGTVTTDTTTRNGTLDGTTTIQLRGRYGSELLSFASGTGTDDIVTAINDRSALTGVAASANQGATGAGPKMLSIHSTTYGTDAFIAVSVLENNGTSVGDAIGFASGAADNRETGVDGTFAVNGTAAIVKGLDVSVRAGDLSLDLTLSTSFGNGTSVDGTGAATSATSFEITGGGAVFSISPTVGLSGQESVGIGEVSTSKLGDYGNGFLSSLGSGLTNDLSSTNFTAAQRIVRSSINQIALLRGRLGAFQKDTIGSTIDSLQVARENIVAAESAIRDADFAEETAALTRAQILVNSSTTVLQIANAQPQNVLALLG
ncbi:MAG: flagellin [Phycisphaerales bacterium]|nr:MAG: flagellin [Phycisphaerales bacterium]